MNKIYEASKDVHANYLVYLNSTDSKLYADAKFNKVLDAGEVVRAFKANELVVVTGENAFAKAISWTGAGFIIATVSGSTPALALVTLASA